MIYSKSYFNNVTAASHSVLIPRHEIGNLGDWFSLEEAAREAGLANVSTCKAGFYCFEPDGHIFCKYRVAKI